MQVLFKHAICLVKLSKICKMHITRSRIITVLQDANFHRVLPNFGVRDVRSAPGVARLTATSAIPDDVKRR